MKKAAAVIAILVILAGAAWIVLEHLAPPPDPGTEAPRSVSGEPTRNSDERSAGAADSDAESETTSIVGVVVGPKGARVPDALVQVVARDAATEWSESAPEVREARTDASGRFVFHDLAAGTHSILARAASGFGAVPLVRVSATAPARVTVRLLADGYVAGRVVDGRGQPVAGARITTDGAAAVRALFYQMYQQRFRPKLTVEAVSDAGGRFRLGPLVRARYAIEIRAPGHVRSERSGVPVPGPEVIVRLRDGGGLRGRVVLTGTKRPAKIELLTHPRSSVESISSEGHETPFAFEGLPPGVYRLRARAAGYTEGETTIRIEAGAFADAGPIVLSPGTRLSGRVIAAGTGQPVADAEVLVWRVERSGPWTSSFPEETLKTDAAGRFETLVRPGEWLLGAVKPGYENDDEEGDSDLSFTVGEDPVERTVRLVAPRAAITGVVTGPDGTPVAGAEVEVIGVGNSREDERPITLNDEMCATTAKDGTFRLVRHIVPWGSYDLMAAHPEGITARVSGIVFAEGETEVAVRFVLEPRAISSGRLTGRIIDETGGPIPGAIVAIPRGSAVTTENGRFEKDRVPAGRFRVRYQALGRPMALSDLLEIRPGETTDAGDLVLPASGLVISGRLTDTKGEPVEGADVTAWFNLPDQESRLFDAPSGPDGTYRIDGPAISAEIAGITVQVRADGFLFRQERRTARSEEAMDFVLTRYGGLAGRVSFRGPPPDRIDLQRWNGGVWNSLHVEWNRETGDYTSAYAPPGHYRIRLRADGFAPGGHQGVTVAESETATLGPTTLSAGGTISGRVVDAEGHALADVRVWVAAEFLYQDTDAGGRFQLTHVPPGTVTIGLGLPEGRESPEFRVTVTEGQTAEVVLTVN